MNSVSLLLLAVGLATGVTTVLFGFGGGFVTVPAVYVASSATVEAGGMHIAVATSTAVMIVNAAWATISSMRRGQLIRGYLWPLTAFIAVGAVLGAFAANWAPDRVLHALFVVYIGATMIDCITRTGFLTVSPDREVAAPLSAVESTLGGVGIGCIAAFLGVGGSVLTVPLLRRKRVDMEAATTLANPLSLPVAIAASIIYALPLPGAQQFGQMGNINVTAAALLLLGSVPTIAVTKALLAQRKIPDRVHAVMYLILLGIVAVSMTATLTR